MSAVVKLKRVEFPKGYQEQETICSEPVAAERSSSEGQEPRQSYGSVIDVQGAELHVRTPQGDPLGEVARRAVSCLVAPMVGDQVLLTRLPDGRLFVLAVLEREAAQVTQIDAPDGLAFRVGRSFEVVAAEGVALTTSGELSTHAASVRINALEGSVAVRRLALLTEVGQFDFGTLKLVGRCFDTVADRLSQTVRRLYRTVSEMDQLRAKRVDYVAEEALTLRGDNALITAKELVKLNGKQVHMG